MSDTTAKKSSPLAIALAWTVVIIPAAWGFNNTLHNAMKIFTAPATSANPGPR